MKRVRVWPVALAAAGGCAVLAGLGAWQLQRLEWKTALLAAIAEHGHAPPVSLAEALARHERGEDVDYLTVTATGRYTGEFRAMLASRDGNPAWRLVAPLAGAGGIAVLVARGLVPEGMKETPPPAGEVTVSGQVALHRGPRGAFTPDNDAAGNIWYWYDIPAMFGEDGKTAGFRQAPFVLHLAKADGAAPWPRPEPLSAGIRNNHLGYASTWLGLAAVLAVIAGVYIARERRASRGRR